MADQNTLKRLKAALETGTIEEWNTWRRSEQDANRDGPGLREADLRGANLYDADLQFADLRGAYLEGADLRNADLSGAILLAANLSNARLAGANFSDVALGLATLASVDLSSVIGLETCRHLFPSSIGIETIYESGGKIPEAFLRGAGVPESFIVQIPALIGALQPIQFYSCFISYSTKDQAFADRLHADLQAKGVRCWLGSEDFKIGDRFRDRIEDSIRVFDRLLLVLSTHSIQSSWVRTEVEAAFEKERRLGKDVLFPIRLDDEVMNTTTAWAADIRRTRHIGDFTNWKDHDAFTVAFGRLLRDLAGTKGDGG